MSFAKIVFKAFIIRKRNELARELIELVRAEKLDIARIKQITFEIREINKAVNMLD